MRRVFTRMPFALPSRACSSTVTRIASGVGYEVNVATDPGKLNFITLVDARNLYHTMSIHFSSLFPSLAHLTFAEILERSTEFLKSNAAAVAAAAAVSSVAADRSVAIDRMLVSQHSAIATTKGLHGLLLELSQAFRPYSLQPL